MFLGINTAIIKYSSEEENVDRQTNIISTGFFLILIFTIISAIVYFSFKLQLSNIFSISDELFGLSVIFAILYVFFMLTSGTLKGLFKMKIFAIIQPLCNVIILFVFLFFIFINLSSVTFVVYSIFLAYVITGLISLIFLRRYLKFRIKKNWTSILSKYGMFTLIGGLSFVFYTNIDKILINRYMTLTDLGIYKAYYFSSINLLGVLFGVFNTVFFPTISKYEKKEMIFRKINKVVPPLIIFGVPIVIICEFIILNLYGGGYPIDFLLLLLFSITSILIVWYGLYDWTFCSEGTKGVKLVNVGTVTISILDILLNIYMIPRFGLYGAIGATAIAFIAGIFLLSILKRRLA